METSVNKMGDWETPRLNISRLKEDEIAEVQDLYETSRYINGWDGQTYNPDHIKKCFYEGNLPPGGRIEKYEIQTIRSKEDASLIGILSVYYAYPTKKCVYLEFLYIDKNIQQKGFGKEVVEHWVEGVTALGYQEARINVALKNWPALKFWFNCEFRGICGIYGDPEISEHAYANMELVKVLKKVELE